MIQERTTINDPVVKLCEYWIGAQLMHNHAHDERHVLRDEDLLRSSGAVDLIIYLRFWLASLYVVAEGYLELQLNDPKLDKLLAKHFGILKLHRHGVFHFQKHNRKEIGLLRELNWAEALHAEFGRYFKRYLKRAGPYLPAQTQSSSKAIAPKKTP